MAKSKKGTDPDTAGEDTVRAEDASLPGEAQDTDAAGDAPAEAPDAWDDSSRTDAPDTLDGDDTAALTDGQPMEGVSPDTVEGAAEDTADTVPADEAEPAVDARNAGAGLYDDGDDVAATEEDDTLGESYPEAETVGEDSVANLSDTLPGPGESGEAAEDRYVTGAHGAAGTNVVEKVVVERKGGFASMVLGGVVAAALGYVAGAWPDLPFMAAEEPVENPFFAETRTTLSAQDEELQTLAARLEQTEGAVAGIELAPLADSMAELQDGLADADTSLSGLGDQLTALDERLTAIEKRPMEEAVSPETIAAYERELQALRDSMAEQKTILDEQRAEIENMAQEAVAAEQSADAKAELAESRAAAADLITRAQGGQPYAEPISVLTENGVSVPDALAANAEDGLPTNTQLAETFPDMAREALKEARRANAGEDGSQGLGSFFQNQLGARSVTPREGDDPDAVLSRAEAAVKAGDLDTALAEIETLPAEAQAVLADWTAQATLRRDALSQAQALVMELNNEQGSE